MKPKYGTIRSEVDRAGIFSRTITGIEYDVIGYCDDLAYYQGEDSIFKAQRVANRMSDSEKGEELIDFVKGSNARMEAEYNSN